jgi:phosphoribosylformylglycinamidine synthase subunit PurL
MKGVVKGIGDYGNAFGIPTVGGEVYFDECYNQNPLGERHERGHRGSGQDHQRHIRTAWAIPVFIVGSATGKDGIHGATFASEDITEASA